jgi:hypothetical protein
LKEKENEEDENEKEKGKEKKDVISRQSVSEYYQSIVPEDKIQGK